MNEGTHSGEYGGKVLRTFKGGGKQWKSGEILTVEDIEEWPLQNRIALANVGKVRWYGEPAKVKKESKPKKTKAKKDPAKKDPAKKAPRKRQRAK